MRHVVLALALFAAACGAPQTHAPEANEAQSAELTLSEAWAAPTPGGVDVSAGYVTITNGTANEDRLLSVSSPRAERAEVHEMSMDGGVMRMRAVEGGLAIAAGETVVLGPGGLHLMFYGVTQPFTEGESVPVTLRFETAGDRTLEMPVRRSESGHGGGH